MEEAPRKPVEDILVNINKNNICSIESILDGQSTTFRVVCEPEHKVKVLSALLDSFCCILGQYESNPVISPTGNRNKTELVVTLPTQAISDLGTEIFSRLSVKLHSI